MIVNLELKKINQDKLNCEKSVIHGDKNGHFICIKLRRG